MMYVPAVFFSLKFGKEVVLSDVSLVNVPGLLLIARVNCLALVIPATSNVPLYAEFATPVVLALLLILTISTVAPLVKLCGISVTMLATPVSQLASATNLGFLN